MKLVRRHKTPFNRQVYESVAIILCKADYRLNRKGEWNGAKIPKMIVEVGEEAEQKDYNGQPLVKRKDSNLRESKARKKIKVNEEHQPSLGNEVNNQQSSPMETPKDKGCTVKPRAGKRLRKTMGEEQTLITDFIFKTEYKTKGKGENRAPLSTEFGSTDVRKLR